MIDIAAVNTPINVCTYFGKQCLDAFSFFPDGLWLVIHILYFYLCQAINSDEFYKAFSQMMGKSIMFIVNKSSHDPHFMQSPFEILRVSNEDSVIKYFTERGLCKTPSKVMFYLGCRYFSYHFSVW
jgi:hypothetical protein